MPGPLLQTLQGANLSRRPIWLMRQAGRYLPEYRELRAERGGFLKLVYDTDAAAEVTVQPIRRFGFDGAILFLEDVEEAEYRIDRMLTQLALAGILKNLAGAVFGQCTSCTGSSSGAYGGFTVNDVLRQHLGPLGVPVYTGAWFGHITDQFTLPVGGLAEIDADAGTLRLLEPVVS